VQGHRVLGVVRHPADQQAGQPGRVPVVTSDREPDDLLKSIKVKPYAYDLVIVPSPVRDGVFAPEGTASFSGLWLDNDDNTDFNCMAAVARVAPQILSLDSVLQIVRERTNDEARWRRSARSTARSRFARSNPAKAAPSSMRSTPSPAGPICARASSSRR